MVRDTLVSTCSLNQWALDFEGNVKRILISIQRSYQAGCRFRLGPELEITGYSCEDHFLELDTFEHSLECLVEILEKAPKDMINVIGMPVMHRNTAYNCEVVLFGGQVQLIRPKMAMSDDNNYRESRYFTAWSKSKTLEQYRVPKVLRDVIDQQSIPFGDAVIATLDCDIGFETCEEMWCAQSMHAQLCLDGVEVICNASASQHTLGRLNERLSQFVANGQKLGGIYLFANQRGCDGQRLYFDGNPFVLQNGETVARGEMFGIDEVEVIICAVDIDTVKTLRNVSKSSRIQRSLLNHQTHPHELPSIVEEIAYGPACWLWDYLRRSGQRGFQLALSGGKDSAAVACLVYHMCYLVAKQCYKEKHEKQTDTPTIDDVNRIVGSNKDGVLGDLGKDKDGTATAKALCSRLLHTCYLATSNSSQDTRKMAKELAESLGCCFREVEIDPAVLAVNKIFTDATGKEPQYASLGGTAAENLALQNIQARLRMVITYMFAQLEPWCNDVQGSLLVLGTSNVDECLRGYLTKYDCSSADINPIGSLSKNDLNLFLAYMRDRFQIAPLKDILECPPTAELTPLTEDGKVAQSDEVEMGMTYTELSHFGKLRRIERCGPFSMFCRLMEEWAGQVDVAEIARKVKHFYRMYAINRHKATVSTPAYHAEAYSPDDHRFDHRPFLYNVQWPWQFRKIDEHVQSLQK